jgi:hypothetical protein
MTLPFAPHDVFIAAGVRLAEAFEGGIGLVRSILRMFESSCRRIFLKFERFSSLKESFCAASKSRALYSGARFSTRAAAPDQGNLVFALA